MLTQPMKSDDDDDDDYGVKGIRSGSCLKHDELASLTQLDTKAIMHELSIDSEITFRKVMGSAEILLTRPSVDPFEDTRPIWPIAGHG